MVPLAFTHSHIYIRAHVYKPMVAVFQPPKEPPQCRPDFFFLGKSAWSQVVTPSLKANLPHLGPPGLEGRISWYPMFFRFVYFRHGEPSQTQKRSGSESWHQLLGDLVRNLPRQFRATQVNWPPFYSPASVQTGSELWIHSPP